MNDSYTSNDKIKTDANEAEQKEKEDLVDEILRRNREIIFIDNILKPRRERV